MSISTYPYGLKWTYREQADALDYCDDCGGAFLDLDGEGCPYCDVAGNWISCPTCPEVFHKSRECPRCSGLLAHPNFN